MKRHLDQEIFFPLRDVIYRYSGIWIADCESELVRTRLARRLRALGAASFSEYLNVLQGSEGTKEIPELVDAVTTNYTFFFRDSEHFQFLAAAVLPTLLREGSGSLRAWSAGCSTGEEAYSIAMTFAESTQASGRFDFRLLATDINRKVIRTASAGIYPESKLTRLPPGYRYKYWVRDAETPPGSLRVVEELRRLVVFQRANVLEAPVGADSRFDFIFCRNVMMYFDGQTRARLAQRFWQVLRPGGYLFTAPAERMKDIFHGLQAVSPTIYRKP